MTLFKTALVSGAAALALGLAACGDATDEAAINGEDSAMTTPAETDGAEPAGNQRAAAAGDRASVDDADSLPEGDECGASKVAAFVSLTATPEVRAKVAADVGHNRIRWIGPDTVVTMDFRPDRLNVMLDGNDVITGAKCS